MLIDIVRKGSTDRSVTLRIIDSTDGTPETGVVWNTSGIDLWYRREGAAVSSVTEATLAALTTAHTDGGFLHISHGNYRFDLPDDAFATGANYVDIGGTVTGMVVIGGRVRLTDIDIEDTVRAGLTALPNAAADAAGGLVVSDAGGLDIDSKLANTNEITVARMDALTDWINGGRLDLLLDAILADTAELQTDWVNGGRLDLILDSRMAEASINTTAGVVNTVNLVNTTTTNTDMRGTDGANTTTPLTAAQVNAEVLDVMVTDTFAEPSSVPAATSSLKDKIGYIFTRLRNKSTQTATTHLLRNDADTATIGTSTVSDDGTTYTKGEDV